MCYRGRLRATTDFLSDDGVRARDALRGVCACGGAGSELDGRCTYPLFSSCVG